MSQCGRIVPRFGVEVRSNSTSKSRTENVKRSINNVEGARCGERSDFSSMASLHVLVARLMSCMLRPVAR